MIVGNCAPSDLYAYRRPNHLQPVQVDSIHLMWRHSQYPFAAFMLSLTLPEQMPFSIDEESSQALQLLLPLGSL